MDKLDGTRFGRYFGALIKEGRKKWTRLSLCGPYMSSKSEALGNTKIVYCVLLLSALNSSIVG